jgi:excisionase family DNA binding protein
MSIPEKIEQTGRAITAKELAHYLSLPKVTVYKHARAGKIPCFRIGTVVRFDPHTIAAWLRAHELSASY